MSDRDTPVTTDELHAYMDGELPADRLGAVEAWLLTHPADAARVAEWRPQAEAIRVRYGTRAREPVPARLSLDRLARTRRPWQAVAAVAVISACLGGIASWIVHGATVAPPSGFDLTTADALAAHKLYV